MGRGIVRKVEGLFPQSTLDERVNPTRGAAAPALRAVDGVQSVLQLASPERQRGSAAIK